jgi:SOS response regulatory protein OraA/RecX
MATPDAVDTAVRALTRRDRSETDVRRILARKGIPEAEVVAALEVLRRIGALDDSRFATRSAEALAARGLGDAAILFRLEREGVDPGLAADAVAALEPECDRAAALAETRGASAKTARWLAGRGFAPESVESAVRRIAERDPPELG